MAERRPLQFATGNKIYEARLTADEAALRAMKHFAALQQNMKQNLAVLCFFARLGKKMEPMIGIEPMTYSLRVNCSTD